VNLRWYVSWMSDASQLFGSRVSGIRKMIPCTAISVSVEGALHARLLQPDKAAGCQLTVLDLLGIDSPFAPTGYPSLHCEVLMRLRRKMMLGLVIAIGPAEGATNAVGIARNVAVDVVEAVGVVGVVGVAVVDAGNVVVAAKRPDTGSAPVWDPGSLDGKRNRSRCRILWNACRLVAGMLRPSLVAVLKQWMGSHSY
jgi:hypothetical protein